MAKIIKQAKAKQFKVDDVVYFLQPSWDGVNSSRVYGSVVKVCPVNLHVEDYDGNIWSVSKEEAK
jgi:hypothetical protein